MKIDTDSLQVIHKEGTERFEIQVGSHIAELTYVAQGDTILFTHTGVPPELGGQGIGSKLVQAGLAYARSKKLKVKSICWFVSGYIKRHPESIQA